MELGAESKFMKVRERSSPLVSIDFECLAKYTRYPFGLLIPQNVTEQALTQFLKSLGVKVLRPRTVTGMKKNEQDKYLVDVSFENCHIITARYIVGTDGVRSIVRKLGQSLRSVFNHLVSGPPIGWHWFCGS